ncbi:MAG: hypothetical protein JWQ59_823 [Cryobacterium sp.]|nr:hypothetical protein [Cryobacterium sp.]
MHHNTLECNKKGILVILGTPDARIEDNRITAGGHSVSGIEVGNGPGTLIRDNTITDGADDFWAILRAENGIRADAGKDIEVADNVLKGIGDTELRITAGVRR